jgi:uncharacterized phage infection (PIP) family protein YhgE
VLSAVGGFLSVTALTQIVPAASLRALLATNVVTAIAAPLIGYAVMSIFLGNLGAGFSGVTQMLGVAILYCLIVGLISTLMARVLGQGGMFGVILVIVVLTFPGSGDPAAVDLLPGFWHGLHSWWVGSAAFEAIRSIVYFNGAQADTWISHLVIWALAVAAILATLEIAKVARKRRAAATVESATARH